MAKPRLWLLAGIAVVITVSAGAWVFQIRQRQAIEPPARLGPWSLGDAFEKPTPEEARHAIAPYVPKRPAAGAGNVVAAVSPPREGSLATEPVTPASLNGPVDSPIAALGKRVDMSAKPLNLPVVVPHADSTGASKLFGVQQRRSDTYVPGNLHGWIGYDISFDKPLLVRAGGELRAGSDAAGPSGLKASEYEKALAGRRAEFQFRGNSRVINTAPFLALIGRICSREICSTPFLVGSGTVLCPSPISVKGELQLWTNNYVRLEGFQTLLPYSRVSGGYRFQAEVAPAGACGTDAATPESSAPRADVAAIDAGQVLKESSFIVSSRQTSWKPFFLPLDRALVIRASGYMQPREAVLGTDPNGIAVPDGKPWSYPGAGSVAVDAAHTLFDPRLPYQALIGRLCSATACSDAFLVGSERTICPTSLDERLELWVNHIVQPSGTRQFNIDVLAFQTRRGEYRFEVAKAAAGSCGK
ncbi:MAG TPA: hypothetical protein VES67_06015 [Vicinamibacterales bacterium]|nr:hypothetical protein [Vicinamibacterales bacterium]